MVECRSFLNDIVLQTDISDRGQWNPDTQGGYTVSGAYHILTTPTEPTDVGLLDLVWHKQVPLKVSIFAWRLLRDRLPTKNNLVREEVCSMPRMLGVLPDAVTTIQYLICLCIVIAMGLYGGTSGRGLAFQVSNLMV